MFYRIVESKNSQFKEGDHVIANFGWRTHTVSNGENVYKLDRKMFTDEKLSAALGVLGMTGYVIRTSVLNVARCYDPVEPSLCP